MSKSERYKKHREKRINVGIAHILDSTEANIRSYLKANGYTAMVKLTVNLSCLQPLHFNDDPEQQALPIADTEDDAPSNPAGEWKQGSFDYVRNANDTDLGGV